MLKMPREATSPRQAYAESSVVMGAELRQGIVSLVRAESSVTFSDGETMSSKRDHIAQDLRIVRAVKRAFETDEQISLQSVQTTVSYGHVLVEGTVPSALAQSRLEKLLEPIQDIESIINWVQVACLVKAKDRNNRG